MLSLHSQTPNGKGIHCVVMQQKPKHLLHLFVSFRFVAITILLANTKSSRVLSHTMETEWRQITDNCCDACVEIYLFFFFWIQINAAVIIIFYLANPDRRMRWFTIPFQSIRWWIHFNKWCNCISFGQRNQERPFVIIVLTGEKSE